MLLAILNAMNKWYCLSMFLLICGFCEAQNLVPNPSFEQYDTCPNNLTQISRAIGWSSYSITPDYFNSCAPDTEALSFSVPSNYFGFQYARSGNGYAGIVTFDQYSANEREYIGIHLNQSLTVGAKYFASFYVSRAVTPYILVNIANNKIGLRLSTVPYTQSNPAPVNNFAQVYSDSIISDTLNWIKISGSFIADSVYNYLSIGNFFDDSLTSFVAYNSSAFAYYYVDDVYLSADSLEGINENYLSQSINIFPNPFNDKLNIFVKENEPTELILYDILSQKLLQRTFINSTTIDTEKLAKGIYIYELKNKNRVIKNGKVVKD